MVMSDGLQILRAIERQHDLFRLMQRGVVLDVKTGEVYEGVSDGDHSRIHPCLPMVGRDMGL